MFFGEMTMKKVLIAALLAGMSLSASAAQTIRFATEASYPPFELVDANNQIVGFDVDLANALCKEIDAAAFLSRQTTVLHRTDPLVADGLPSGIFCLSAGFVTAHFHHLFRP